MRKLRNPDPELDMWYRSETCTVYLLHFARPIYNAQHYIGSTEDLDRRLREHQRTWPLYRLDDAAFDTLMDIIPDSILGEIEDLHGKTFRRKHTFLDSIHRRIGLEHFDIEFLKAAKRHTANGLVMRANQLGITWCVARTWAANRDFEMHLKRQKNTRRYCPVCHDMMPPDEAPPF